MRLNLPTGTYQYDDPSVSSRNLINCTAEPVPAGKSQVLIKRMPGIDDLTTLGTAGRGEHRFKGDLYVVSGTSLFKRTLGGAETTVGTIAGSNRVSIADNGIDMCIVSEPDGYFSDGVTVDKITDGFFTSGGAKDVDILDGFFVFTRPDSEIFFNTLLKSRTLDALNFASADRSSDNLVGLIVDQGEIFLAGEKTCEFFYNASLSPGSPFARSPNGLIEIGCAAGDTLAKIDNTIFWLANDDTVRRLAARTPVIVSKPGISDLIKDQDSSQAFGFSYTFEEKLYYVLTWPELTLEYDLNASEWHVRKSRLKDLWRPVNIIEFNGLTVLDALSGQVGTLNSSTKTEFGEIQLVKFGFNAVYVEGLNLAHDRLELNISVGRGATSGQGSNPEIILSISEDGGSTFTEYQRRSLGALGKRETRVFWTGLGSSRNRVYEFTLSDPVDMFVFDANLDVRAEQRAA